MTNRDFFRLMIKLFGLYQFFVITFSFLPQILSLFNDELYSKWEVVVTLLLTILIMFGIFYFLLKFPDKIIDLFNLDKGFDDEKITINNLNANTILQIGLVLIGGFLIVENISSFISYLISYFRISNFNHEMYDSLKEMKSLIFTGINLILGFVLIIYRRQIAEKF